MNRHLFRQWLSMTLVMLACIRLGLSQANQGELQLRITDPSGHGIKVQVHVIGDAIQYDALLVTDSQGAVTAQRLPFGFYRVQVQEPGFDVLSEAIEVHSSIPVRRLLQLRIASVLQSVTVDAIKTLLDPDQAGAVNRIGGAMLESRIGSLPGRSLQDLVNSQPGWLYEGNAVLHPRGSEYQTQFVIDGVPMTDNRSPGFGPEIEADDTQSVNIYTAGIPAEYGRKMGGVIEINTLKDAQAGLHGHTVLSGGTYHTAAAFSEAQLVWGRNSLNATGSGSRTDHYLNPVVPQNYSNTGTQGDFGGNYRRSLGSNDDLSLTLRHALARYDLPNELVQQGKGQRQTGDNLETTGTLAYRHIYSSFGAADFRVMARDNSTDLISNQASTPIEVFHHNSFREAYLKAGAVFDHGHQEWKTGFETDNTFLHENLTYQITDPSQFDSQTPPSFAFNGSRPDLEQSIFVQDQLRLNHWTIHAGLRWDHYQLVRNKEALQPRLAISHYFPKTEMMIHVAYDRVFQTPSFSNILLSSSSQVQSISPSGFLRLPLQPSQGNYYEAGLSKAFGTRLKVESNVFRRNLSNFGDDNQLQNTSISFPISFRKGIIYGAEAKLTLPPWHKVSGFGSYSYALGNVWFPVTGGLFLGSDAANAASQLSGHFPDSQDQRNTVRGRLRYDLSKRIWVAIGLQMDSGLPFQYGGTEQQALLQYGRQVLSRINFARGRIRPTVQANASLGLDVYRSDKLKAHLQVDGTNLSDVLDVINFGGLFSGNAIGPTRSVTARFDVRF